jgi:hypothetical protein
MPQVNIARKQVVRLRVRESIKGKRRTSTKLVDGLSTFQPDDVQRQKQSSSHDCST